ncbi:hypothetical protein TNCV_2131691 [Trichonephila clavipes]|nr:hypothetical protein TNCV_2131691 [Trichonephila clavipes]
MQMLGTKRRRQREYSKRVQLARANQDYNKKKKGRFSASEFFHEIWLEEIIWTTSHDGRTIGKQRRSLTSAAEEFGIKKSVSSRLPKHRYFC